MADNNPPAGPDVHLAADDGRSFVTDSAYGANDEASERTSLFSDIMKHREENGRRYHGYKDGAYLLPNDEAEQKRLDLHHHIFTLANKGRLYQAPIDKPGRVLDLGTGTGIWALDFADAHSESHVIGTDLSAIQPEWVTPNLEFLVEDAEDEWIGASYDYIHIRMLSGAIKDWPALLDKAFEFLNPGGWIEVTEFEVQVRSNNGRLDKAPQCKRWQQGLEEAARKFGRRMDAATHLKQWVRDANFTDVVEQKLAVPTGTWPKDKEQKTLGAYQLLNMLDAASVYGQAHFIRVLGWSPAEYDAMSTITRVELRDPKLQLYSDLYTVYGRKPSASP